MSTIDANGLGVKIDIQVQAHARPGYTIEKHRRETIITINYGQIVITLKPP